jgi:hypothetical protein
VGLLSLKTRYNIFNNQSVTSDFAEWESGAVQLLMLPINILVPLVDALYSQSKRQQLLEESAHLSRAVDEVDLQDPVPLPPARVGGS